MTREQADRTTHAAAAGAAASTPVPAVPSPAPAPAASATPSFSSMLAQISRLNESFLRRHSTTPDVSSLPIQPLTSALDAARWIVRTEVEYGSYVFFRIALPMRKTIQHATTEARTAAEMAGRAGAGTRAVASTSVSHSLLTKTLQLYCRGIGGEVELFVSPATPTPSTAAASSSSSSSSSAAAGSGSGSSAVDPSSGGGGAPCMASKRPTKLDHVWALERGSRELQLSSRSEPKLLPACNVYYIGVTAHAPPQGLDLTSDSSATTQQQQQQSPSSLSAKAKDRPTSVQVVLKIVSLETDASALAAAEATDPSSSDFSSPAAGAGSDPFSSLNLQKKSVSILDKLQGRLRTLRSTPKALSAFHASIGEIVAQRTKQSDRTAKQEKDWVARNRQEQTKQQQLLPTAAASEEAAASLTHVTRPTPFVFATEELIAARSRLKSINAAAPPAAAAAAADAVDASNASADPAATAAAHSLALPAQSQPAGRKSVVLSSKPLDKGKLARGSFSTGGSGGGGGGGSSQQTTASSPALGSEGGSGGLPAHPPSLRLSLSSIAPAPAAPLVLLRSRSSEDEAAAAAAAAGADFSLPFALPASPLVLSGSASGSSASLASSARPSPALRPAKAASGNVSASSSVSGLAAAAAALSSERGNKRGGGGRNKAGGGGKDLAPQHSAASIASGSNDDRSSLLDRESSLASSVSASASASASAGSPSFEPFTHFFSPSHSSGSGSGGLLSASSSGFGSQHSILEHRGLSASQRVALAAQEEDKRLAAALAMDVSLDSILQNSPARQRWVAQMVRKDAAERERAASRSREASPQRSGAGSKQPSAPASRPSTSHSLRPAGSPRAVTPSSVPVAAATSPAGGASPRSPSSHRHRRDFSASGRVHIRSLSRTLQLRPPAINALAKEHELAGSTELDVRAALAPHKALKIEDQASRSAAKSMLREAQRFQATRRAMMQEQQQLQSYVGLATPSPDSAPPATSAMSPEPSVASQWQQASSEASHSAHEDEDSEEDDRQPYPPPPPPKHVALVQPEIEVTEPAVDGFTFREQQARAAAAHQLTHVGTAAEMRRTRHALNASLRARQSQASASGHTQSNATTAVGGAGSSEFKGSDMLRSPRSKADPTRWIGGTFAVRSVAGVAASNPQIVGMREAAATAAALPHKRNGDRGHVFSYLVSLAQQGGASSHRLVPSKQPRSAKLGKPDLLIQIRQTRSTTPGTSGVASPVASPRAQSAGAVQQSRPAPRSAAAVRTNQDTLAALNSQDDAETEEDVQPPLESTEVQQLPAADQLPSLSETAPVPSATEQPSPRALSPRPQSSRSGGPSPARSSRAVSPVRSGSAAAAATAPLESEVESPSKKYVRATSVPLSPPKTKRSSLLPTVAAVDGGVIGVAATSTADGRPATAPGLYASKDEPSLYCAPGASDALAVARAESRASAASRAGSAHHPHHAPTDSDEFDFSVPEAAAAEVEEEVLPTWSPPAPLSDGGAAAASFDILQSLKQSEWWAARHPRFHSLPLDSLSAAALLLSWGTAFAPKLERALDSLQWALLHSLLSLPLTPVVISSTVQLDLQRVHPELEPSARELVAAWLQHQVALSAARLGGPGFIPGPAASDPELIALTNDFVAGLQPLPQSHVLRTTDLWLESKRGRARWTVLDRRLWAECVHAGRQRLAQLRWELEQLRLRMLSEYERRGQRSDAEKRAAQAMVVPTVPDLLPTAAEQAIAAQRRALATPPYASKHSDHKEQSSEPSEADSYRPASSWGFKTLTPGFHALPPATGGAALWNRVLPPSAPRDGASTARTPSRPTTGPKQQPTGSQSARGRRTASRDATPASALSSPSSQTVRPATVDAPPAFRSLHADRNVWTAEEQSQERRARWAKFMAPPEKLGAKPTMALSLRERGLLPPTAPRTASQAQPNGRTAASREGLSSAARSELASATPDDSALAVESAPSPSASGPAVESQSQIEQRIARQIALAKLRESYSSMFSASRAERQALLDSCERPESEKYLVRRGESTSQQLAPIVNPLQTSSALSHNRGDIFGSLESLTNAGEEEDGGNFLTSKRARLYGSDPLSLYFTHAGTKAAGASGASKPLNIYERAQMRAKFKEARLRARTEAARLRAFQAGASERDTHLQLSANQDLPSEEEDPDLADLPSDPADESDATSAVQGPASALSYMNRHRTDQLALLSPDLRASQFRSTQSRTHASLSDADSPAIALGEFKYLSREDLLRR